MVTIWNIWYNQYLVQYILSCIYDSIWRFPDMAVPLNHPFWGSPIFRNIHIYTYWTLYLLFFGVRYENLCFFWWSHKNLCYSIKTYVFSDPHVLRCFNMFQLSPMGFDSINIHIYSCPKGLIFLQDGCYRTCSGSGHIPRWWLKLNIISIGQVGMGGTK